MTQTIVPTTKNTTKLSYNNHITKFGDQTTTNSQQTYNQCTTNKIQPTYNPNHGTYNQGRDQSIVQSRP